MDDTRHPSGFVVHIPVLLNGRDTFRVSVVSQRVLDKDQVLMVLGGAKTPKQCWSVEVRKKISMDAVSERSTRRMRMTMTR